MGRGLNRICIAWLSGIMVLSDPSSYLAQQAVDRLTIRGHPDWVKSVSFSSDGKTVTSLGQDGSVRQWDVTKGSGRVIIEGRATCVTFSPDGKWLAWAAREGTDEQRRSVPAELKLREGTIGKDHVLLSGEAAAASTMRFSPDGKLLATSTQDGVKLYNVANKDLKVALTGHTARVRSLAFSPTGDLLASGGEDGIVIVWDLALGKPRFSLRGHNDYVLSVAFSPDGRVLASGSSDESATLWETATGKKRVVLRAHPDRRCGDYVCCLAFSPSGRMVATAHEHSTVRLWDVTTGKVSKTLQGHTWSVTSVAFSPDGKLLASGSMDKTVKIWSIVEKSE